MTQIKAKTRSGSVQEFHVEEIIEIDGRAYAGDSQELRDAIIRLCGRVDAIEAILSTSLGLDDG